jgi:sec-independent protein translocase protein TatA
VFGFGWMELLLVLIIVLIVFGAGKLPQLGEGLGKAIKGFKKTVHEPEPQEITEVQPGASSTSQASSVSGDPASTPARQETGKASSA